MGFQLKELGVRFNSTITLHVPWSLLLRRNAEEMGDPLCFACSRYSLSILLLSLHTQPERIFVLSAICTSKHAQCRRRVNEVPPLCNFIRDQQTWVYERPLCN